MWRPTPADASALFDARDLDRARRYQRPLRRARLVRRLAAVAVTVALVGLEAGPRLVEALGVDGWVAQLAVVLLALELARLLVDGPVDAWADLVHDRRWGLSSQTARGLVAEEARSTLLSVAVGMAVLVPVYALVRATAWWWLWTWVLALVVGVLYPVVAAPLRRRLAPLEGELADRLRVVADRAGVEVARVEVADESHLPRRDDAYVAGLGPTRRLVLSDALLDAPPELVEQVVAHELGHVRRHHLTRQLPVLAVLALLATAALGLLSRWTGLFEAVGVDGPGDPAGLPLALLAVELAVAVVAPVEAWVSRAFEREADREALVLLGRPDRAEAVLRRLHVRNLADLDPGPLERLRASHPPVAERIAFARAWAAAQVVR